MRFHDINIYFPTAIQVVKQPVTGGEHDKNIPLYFDTDDIHKQYIQSTLWDKYMELSYKHEVLKPTITYDDIKGTMPYQDDLGGYSKFIVALRNSIHIGQRKLFISELQAMGAMFERFDEFGIIIYAGSAPSMKLWYMMQLYPNAIFILVDPNEFNIYDGEYDLPHYVRQDRDYVKGGSKWRVYTDEAEREYNQNDYVYLSASKRNMYESRFYKQKNILYYNPETRKLEKRNKPYTDSGFGKSARNINNDFGEAPLITERATQESIDYAFATTAKMEANKYVNHYRGGADNAKPDHHRVYFIEEYFTDKIAGFIANASEKYPGIKTAFWSDIRTNTELNGEPGDMDIILNTAWMYSWMRIMKPTVSMLKFRTPYFNDSGVQLNFDRFKESFDSCAQLGYDYRVPTWNEGKFYFFKGTINLQAWEGSHSTETRLIVKREDVIANNMVAYDMQEYENRFMYYNAIERYALFHENSNADREIGFDNCADCAIENVVWSEYKSKRPEFDIKDAIKKLDKLLHVPIKMRRGVFGHGGLFADMTMEEFKRQVSESESRYKI